MADTQVPAMTNLQPTHTPSYHECYSGLQAAIESLAAQLDVILVYPEVLDMLGQWQGDRPVRHMRGLPIYLFPTLPHAAAFYAVNEPCELVCVGQLSPKTFWAYVAEKLSIDVTEVKMPRRDDSSFDVPLTSVSVPADTSLARSQQLRLTYSQCSTDFDPRLSHSYLISKALVDDRTPLCKIYRQQSYEIRRKSALIDERTGLVKTISHDNAFRAFQRWAVATGILSPQLGLMSTECLFQIVQSRFEDALNSLYESKTGIIDLLRWIVNDYYTSPPVSHGARDNMTVLDDTGTWNLADNVSEEGAFAIMHAFRSAAASLRSTEEELSEQEYTQQWGIENKLRSYSTFITVNFTCWVPKMRTEVRASIPDLLLGLQSHVRKKSSCRAVIVPQPVPWSQDDTDAFTVEYILPVYNPQTRHTAISVPNKTALQDLLAVFASELQYDTSSFLIKIALDDRDTLSATISSWLESQGATPVQPRPASTIPPRKPSPTRTPSTFRTARSAMNRLRWDPAHASVDYEIGYLDRFETAALIWKPLERWEKLVEEEDFVPEHRTRQIRRKGDRVCVWDREGRVDLTDGTIARTTVTDNEDGK